MPSNLIGKQWSRFTKTCDETGDFQIGDRRKPLSNSCDVRDLDSRPLTETRPITPVITRKRLYERAGRRITEKEIHYGDVETVHRPQRLGGGREH